MINRALVPVPITRAPLKSSFDRGSPLIEVLGATWPSLTGRTESVEGGRNWIVERVTSKDTRLQSLEVEY